MCSNVHCHPDASAGVPVRMQMSTFAVDFLQKSPSQLPAMEVQISKCSHANDCVLTSFCSSAFCCWHFACFLHSPIVHTFIHIYVLLISAQTHPSGSFVLSICCKTKWCKSISFVLCVFCFLS